MHNFIFKLFNCIKLNQFTFNNKKNCSNPLISFDISQLIRFARVCSNLDDFNNRNLFLTAKLLKQGYRYHKIRKAFSKFYHRHSELIVKGDGNPDDYYVLYKRSK